MRLRVGLVPVLVLLTAGPGLPAVAAPQGTVELTGSRSAWVDVTLPRVATIDYTRSTFVGKGRFVGFYAERVDVAAAQRYRIGATIGAVTLRDFHTPGEPAITEDLAPFDNNGHNRRLQPGRYRFYLLADGSARVRLALAGAPRLSLRPRNPATASAVARSDILRSSLEASSSLPFRVSGQRALVFSAVVIGPVKRAFVGRIGACIAAGDECGDHYADADRPGFVVYPLGDFDFGFSVRYQPGVIGPGSYKALQSALNVTTIEYATGGAFALSLV